MNKRYIEIDSTYRNRNQYPNPSNFTVLISQSGTRDAAHSYDPVSLAAPQKIWIPKSLELGNVNVVDNPTNTKEKFIVSLPQGDANKEPDYYVGYPIEFNEETVKISGWDFSSTVDTLDYFTVNVTPSFSETPTATQTVAFLENVTNFNSGLIFIPGGFTANNYYTGCIVYNDDENEWRPIISYDGLTKMAGLDLSGGAVTNWDNDHTITIRKSPPQSIGVLPGQSGNTYNSATSFILPSETFVSVGDFIRFTEGNNKNIVCRVTGNGSQEISDNLVTVDRILDNIAAEDDKFEVLHFTRDNAVPFCYSGSLVSQQEMVCYEIELINLVLPNSTLTSGGRITFYPYVYVELQNVSGASAGTKGVIYSNNPNSTRMLFRAVIDDLPNPLISPFVKIDGDGMVQTVKFKPNDNFKFGVYLPNGEPLKTVSDDNFSPDSTNPLLQVSALFSIKRL